MIVADDPATVPGSELAANVERLFEVRRRIVALLDGLTEEQLHWKPAPSRWSVGECVQHMVETNRGYAEPIEAKIRELQRQGKVATGPFRYGLFSRWFVGMMEPGSRRKLSAPAMFAPPPQRATRQDGGALLASVDRIARMNRAAEGLDLRAKVVSPVSRLVRLELGMALKLLGAHTLRHVLQAEVVTREPGFPAGVHEGGSA